MRKPLAVDVDEGRGSAPAHLCGPPLQRIPPHFHSGSDRGRRFLIGSHLRMTAAIVAAAFGAFLLPEAFYLDVALWPIGTEDFTVRTDAFSFADVMPLQELASLDAFPYFGLTAGIRLIAHDRARGALATDEPLLSPPLKMAECREARVTPPQMLGHFFSSVAIMCWVASNSGGRR